MSLFTACNKQDIQVHSLQKSLSADQLEIKPKAYSTGWESVPAWSIEMMGDVIIFSYTRSMPQLTNDIAANGFVLVFVRNLWECDNELKKHNVSNEPLMMPFYFLPYFQAVNVSVTVKGNADLTTPAKKIELRYVLIPGAVMKQKNQSKWSGRNLSYEELMQSFGFGS